MTEQNAIALAALIPQEMPSVSAKVGTSKKQSHVVIVQHKPTTLYLSICNIDQWAGIKQAWRMLEEDE